ncbi:hypothetical protein QTI66_37845 [Variovorax sp. J22R133]|uniref:hypothetical protein n=1 Tax=Variovorax brevis TaxID=3053503 RepID=UPI0025751993|nr:hypothetical protein [Variovorax sp. J22R133]MDM0117861.1 hypothetical protein [Variovorax sp. J22R133]
MLRGAQRSLDLQYYHLYDDSTGRLVLRELRDVAQRGVRVRLLLDDLYIDSLAPLLNGLGAYRRKKQMCHRPSRASSSDTRVFSDTFALEICEANVSLRLCTKQIRHSVDAKGRDRA